MTYNLKCFLCWDRTMCAGIETIMEPLEAMHIVKGPCLLWGIAWSSRCYNNHRWYYFCLQILKGFIPQQHQGVNIHEGAKKQQIKIRKEKKAGESGYRSQYLLHACKAGTLPSELIPHTLNLYCFTHTNTSQTMTLMYIWGN